MDEGKWNDFSFFFNQSVRIIYTSTLLSPLFLPFNSFFSIVRLRVSVCTCAHECVWKQAKKNLKFRLYFLTEKFLKFMCIVHTHTLTLAYNWLHVREPLFPMLLPFSVWIAASTCFRSFQLLFSAFCFRSRSDKIDYGVGEPKWRKSQNPPNTST